jgi:hypothetical protein
MTIVKWRLNKIIRRTAQELMPEKLDTEKFLKKEYNLYPFQSQKQFDLTALKKGWLVSYALWAVLLVWQFLGP